jgi:hypothetical protein
VQLEELEQPAGEHAEVATVGGDGIEQRVTGGCGLVQASWARWARALRLCGNRLIGDVVEFADGCRLGQCEVGAQWVVGE